MHLPIRGSPAGMIPWFQPTPIKSRPPILNCTQILDNC
nr:MAG TPA: hypothetical protein [Caudoviricetes sp.]